MVLTFLVGAGFVAVGIAVMVAIAWAAYEPVVEGQPQLEFHNDATIKHRAA
jgi:hypothetical protein